MNQIIDHLGQFCLFRLTAVTLQCHGTLSSESLLSEGASKNLDRGCETFWFITKQAWPFPNQQSINNKILKNGEEKMAKVAVALLNDSIHCCVLRSSGLLFKYSKIMKPIDTRGHTPKTFLLV